MLRKAILQALEDAISTSGVKKDTYWKEDSHKWFLENSKSFQDICWNADLDPEVIREKYVSLVDSGKVVFNELQKSWINYRECYRLYRAAKTKEERKQIKKRIDKLDR